MALNKNWLRKYISDTLKEFDVHSIEATELLMLTAAQESRLGTYLTQVNGPALSIFQIEPATYADIHERILEKKWKGVFSSDCMSLITDFKTSVMACRGKYLSIKEAIPKTNDIKDLAKYWKKYYNTYRGAGKVEDAIRNYKNFCW